MFLASAELREISLRPIFKNAGWYFFEKIVRLAGTFLVGAWVARYLGTVQYGIFAYATALIATLGFMVSWGIESLVIRDLVREPERQAKIISTYYFIRISGAFLASFGAIFYLLFRHSDDNELLSVSLVLSISLILSTMDVADCWLQARQQSRSTSLIRLAGFSLGTLAKISLVLTGAPLIGFAAANVLESMVTALSYWVLLHRGGIKISSWNWNWNEITRLVADGKIMILSGLTVVVYSKIDVLTIGIFLSSEVLGPYAIASNICGAWNMVGLSIAQAWAPHISSAKNKNQTNYIIVLRQFFGTCFLVSVLGSLAITVMSGAIFDKLLGPSYAAGSKSLSILIWSSVPIFMGIATSQIIVNDRLYFISLIRTSIGMATSLTLIVPVILNYGVNGVAILVTGSAFMATLAILFSPSARKVLDDIFFMRKVEST